jgi:hypothetical protein
MRLPLRRALLLTALSSAACGDPSSDSNPILHLEDGRLLDGRGRPVVLRGAAFANGALATPFDPGDAEAAQDSTNYARMAELGMNLAQFYLNARLFERDDAPYVYSEDGFAFVDRNLAWAREHGVYLLLTLAVPPGGEQLDCAGDSLWDEPALADRMTALWEALATRYAHDASVAGYRILRTPLPSGDASQWRDLAAETVARIRAVDPEHLIVIDRADGARCAPDDVLGESFVGIQIDDPNVMNAFEFRWPYEFTNQLIDEIGFGEQGPYPNDQRLLIDWNESEFQHASWDSRPGETALWLKPDETEWTEKRFWYTVTDPDFHFAFPDLQSRNNRGTVYFDDLVIREFDEDGEFVRTVVDYDVETSGPWYLWQPPEENGTGVVGLSSDSHRGNASLTLSNTSTDAALSASMLAFRELDQGRGRLRQRRVDVAPRFLDEPGYAHVLEPAGAVAAARTVRDLESRAPRAAVRERVRHLTPDLRRRSRRARLGRGRAGPDARGRAPLFLFCLQGPQLRLGARRPQLDERARKPTPRRALRAGAASLSRAPSKLPRLVAPARRVYA